MRASDSNSCRPWAEYSLPHDATRFDESEGQVTCAECFGTGNQHHFFCSAVPAFDFSKTTGARELEPPAVPMRAVSERGRFQPLAAQVQSLRGKNPKTGKKSKPVIVRAAPLTPFKKLLKKLEKTSPATVSMLKHNHKG